MPDYADLSIELERAYGRPWRVGEIIQGTVFIYDRDGQITDPNKNITLSGTVYEQRKDWWALDEDNIDAWDETGISVALATVDVGERIFAFAPEKERVYRVDIQAEGDVYARSEVTLNVDGALSDSPAIPDVTISGIVSAPELTFANATGTSQTQATISVETDTGNGTLYWIVSDDATQPLKGQIKNGADASGNNAAESGSRSISNAGSVTINVSNLSNNTIYTTFFMHESADGLQSNIEAAHFKTGTGTVTIGDEGELLYSKNTISTTIF